MFFAFNLLNVILRSFINTMIFANIYIWVTPSPKGAFEHKQHAHTRRFVLRFYGPINPMGSCLARSVYLTTLLLGRLSPLSG